MDMMLDPEPTTPELRAMLAVAVRMAIGGRDAEDIIIRHRIKGVSMRQIAREDQIDRETVAHRVGAYDELISLMRAARYESVPPPPTP